MNAGKVVVALSVSLAVVVVFLRSIVASFVEYPDGRGLLLLLAHVIAGAYAVRAIWEKDL